MKQKQTIKHINKHPPPTPTHQLKKKGKKRKEKKKTNENEIKKKENPSSKKNNNIPAYRVLICEPATYKPISRKRAHYAIEAGCFILVLLLRVYVAGHYTTIQIYSALTSGVLLISENNNFHTPSLIGACKISSTDGAHSMTHYPCV